MGGQASHFVSPAIITTLPNDILLSICNALTDGGDSSSLVPLACTCRDLHQIVFETPTIWLNVFASRFDLHDFHRDPTFDALLELRRREDCLRDAALSGERFELLKEMVVEHVEHNIKRVAGSPAGRAVISFKDLTADTTELALVSAVLQYQPIQPIRARMVIVLNSVRRGQTNHYRLTVSTSISSIFFELMLCPRTERKLLQNKLYTRRYTLQ
ncbi:hypothetical protein BT96DRAFT_921823 [Gymnopus androsaceus JB14]|uniref:F-box domain-containing protein n=1 Tax=Gymnopus androsaceus JB14 TaxID=1447944 RepID=A0A6A4HEQ3_9AGAR|nr:hypothetical protein BT96DRAFT_921823 [Gymnopus androsaceus JB14]